VSSTNTTDRSKGPAATVMTAPAAANQTRVVSPFALACRFDRARGQFVVHAGARAGACAVAAVAVLALGTAGFVRTSLRGGPTPAMAADVVPHAASKRVPATDPASAAEEPPAVTATPKSYSDYVRTPGLNYLVIRSVASKRAALRERDALIRLGVATTVERSLPGWSGKGWYSLVGMTGFDLARGDEELYDRHVKELKDMKLDPKPYKWRGQ
jgi:hypothetical protein